MLETGDWCKHFKGKDLKEKNIYEILETGVTYSGDKAEGPIQNLVIYKNIFQGKIFAREMEDLTAELPTENQIEFGQVHRVEKLTDNEIQEVKRLLNEKTIKD